jgi:ABC-type Fe3+/spermidine/putrescine transport system ATPase subunit
MILSLDPDFPAHERREESPPRGLLLQAFGLCLGNRLKGIDLQLNPTEFVGILAASGAGKTSLLKQLAGFSVPAADQGQIVFDHQPLTTKSLSHKGCFP